MGIDLESVLKGTRVVPVPDAFAGAHVTPDRLERLRRSAEEDPEGHWGGLARRTLDWERPFDQVLDDSRHPFHRWFVGGRLNASANCLDRHLPEHRHRVAYIWEAEDGEVRTLTYGQLHGEVCRFANVLKGLGVAKGDRVVLYMPQVPQLAVAMLACARIGAPHSVVFAGFSAAALADRLIDTGAKVLVTADGGRRNGRVVPLKQNADEALQREGHAIKRVVVLRRTGDDVPLREGRDLDWALAMADASPECPPEPMDAEDILFILYTSGSTGKPKGIVHTTGGYLLWAALTTKWVFDLRPQDMYWCTADVGWVTGHTYLVYGPLANAATSLMYEGAPMHPKPDRFWDLVERHRVSILYTAPTAIRAFMRAGDAWPGRHDLSSLRLLGSVGEPINPEAWEWYHRVIGGGRCPIVDTWWQTETGGILISPLPGATPLKPGSCNRPLPGIHADIIDEEGRSIEDPTRGGRLVLTRPWPSMLRTIWGDDQRYIDTYWKGGRHYVAGDTAHRDADGELWIMGRFDDVLNVSGHRLGTMEVESALVSHADVAEAAVVGAPHAVKGEAVWAFVLLRPDAETDEEALRAHVADAIGKIARPDQVLFVDALPKTRSGKIMRRLLRSVARGEEPGQDTTTLEDPGVMERIRLQAASVVQKAA